MKDPNRIPIFDLFAGPGGLGEGFARCKVGRTRPFSIALSVEKEKQAHRTLQLRSFFRQYESPSKVPEAFYQVLRGEIEPESLADASPLKWAAAKEEALCATLGVDSDDAAIDHRIKVLRKRGRDKASVLIGGPPCQAYSLVGRARNRGILGYRAENDKRHQLYLEYLRIITKIWPAAFVMENVKGILSSKVGAEEMFPRILDDLRSPRKALGLQGRTGPSVRYRLVPVAEPLSPSRLFANDDFEPRDYIVRCEQFGVPQRRHRVFIVGLREDLVGDFNPVSRSDNDEVPLSAVLEQLPRLRSGLSPRESNGEWSKSVSSGVSKSLVREISKKTDSETGRIVQRVAQSLKTTRLSRGSEFVPAEMKPVADKDLQSWLPDDRIGGYCNHSTRSHMASDLIRYLFASCYAIQNETSPTLAEFPLSLLPNHRNAGAAARARSMFVDRFKVQVWDQPSTTITSHISKDGHYFIHPDPAQCRSLTVREAARLQTFPDNYFFCGPRTSQYIQVGNAVPPLMAKKIAESVYGFLKTSGCIDG